MFGRVKDVALLLGRIGVAVVFLAHGLQKWNNGIDGTAKFFEMTGIPLPTVAAVFAMTVEILGSVAFLQLRRTLAREESPAALCQPIDGPLPVMTIPASQVGTPPPGRC